VFGIRPVWYKSKDLERIKDVYRGTTVLAYKCYLRHANWHVARLRTRGDSCSDAHSEKLQLIYVIILASHVCRLLTPFLPYTRQFHCSYIRVCLLSLAITSSNATTLLKDSPIFCSFVLVISVV
jgi:hypothetical protein